MIQQASCELQQPAGRLAPTLTPALKLKQRSDGKLAVTPRSQISAVLVTTFDSDLEVKKLVWKSG